jgi:hypothetical protein
MWKRTPISTPTILGIISLLLLMIWRKDQESRFQTLQRLLEKQQTSYDTLTRTLLGVAPDSPSQIVTTLTPQNAPSWQPPDAEFGTLPIDEDLMREYEEYRAQWGTLTGGPARTNPEVESKDLGDPRSWPKMTGSLPT